MITQFNDSDVGQKRHVGHDSLLRLLSVHWHDRTERIKEERNTEELKEQKRMEHGSKCRYRKEQNTEFRTGIEKNGTKRGGTEQI